MNNLPRITTLTPLLLAGKNQVTMDMLVENLPDTTANVTLTIPNQDTPLDLSSPSPEFVSPYPNIILTIFNQHNEQLTSLFIVEHKEPRTTLTLHLPENLPSGEYVGQAELLYAEDVIQTVTTTFQII